VHIEPGDETVAIANLICKPCENLMIGFSASGAWKLQLNSAWEGYGAAYSGYLSTDVTVEAGECDGLHCHGHVNIGP
jgi:hypothetical protein